MFQRDYILRMIEMMGDFMRRVAELMDELSRMRVTDEACRLHCGLPLRAVESLNAGSLTDMLPPTPRFFASELLYARVTAFSCTGEDEEDWLLKSLRLLISLWEEGPLCELRVQRLRELKARLLPLLSGDDLMGCAAFFGQAGEYADMEDAIFQAVALLSGEARAEAVQRGEALLRAAARRDERTLALANTSGHELREAARELAESTIS